MLSLLQVGMFFVGLEVPLQRLIRLWGKSFKERQAMTWQAGLVLSQVAQQLPLDAKIYLEDPQIQPWWVYAHAGYYFYPRYLTISMTDHYYPTDEEFSKWSEYPDEAWLISNKFTHVMSFKNGIHIRPVISTPASSNATSR
jgi:hypothetical protein